MFTSNGAVPASRPTPLSSPLPDGTAAPRRGRPPVPAAEREVARLREENARLARKLAAAETVIEVQKKVAALLELAPLDSSPASGSRWP